MPLSAPIAEERTLWRGKPSWTLLTGRLLLIVATIATIPFLHFLSDGGNVDAKTMELIRFGFWVVVAALLVELLWFAAGLIRLRSTEYTITTQRIMTESGIVSKTLSEIDLRYVDDSSFFQGFLDRILGIGSVYVHSSDASSPSFTLRSIRGPRDVREMIRTHAYQASQRQVLTRET